MQVSIIIPVWNGSQVICACLQALQNQSFREFEIIVVDNASQDNSVDLIETNFPQVKILKSEYNLGFSGGCNLGIEGAQGEILILLNQDVTVYPNWIEEFILAFTQYPSAGIIGGKGLYPEGLIIQHAGGWIEWPLGLAQHYGYQEQDEGQYDTPRLVEFVTGAALGIRRTTLEHVGLLDDSFWPGYYEDVDYCFRARALGFEIWYCPAIVYLHQESFSTNNIERSWYTQRGRLRMLLKHLSLERFLSEFVSAEMTALPQMLHRGQSRALRLAYLDILFETKAILQARGIIEVMVCKKILQALLGLYRQAYKADWQVLNQKIGIELSNHQGLGHREAQLDSSIPLIGTLLVKVRWWLFDLLVGWFIRPMRQQQALLNSQFYQVAEAFHQRFQDMAEENILIINRLIDEDHP